jgi:hypothetical protein
VRAVLAALVLLVTGCTAAGCAAPDHERPVSVSIERAKISFLAASGAVTFQANTASPDGLFGVGLWLADEIPRDPPTPATGGDRLAFTVRNLAGRVGLTEPRHWSSVSWRRQPLDENHERLTLHAYYFEDGLLLGRAILEDQPVRLDRTLTLPLE